MQPADNIRRGGPIPLGPKLPSSSHLGKLKKGPQVPPQVASGPRISTRASRGKGANLRRLAPQSATTAGAIKPLSLKGEERSSSEKELQRMARKEAANISMSLGAKMKFRSDVVGKRRLMAMIKGSKSRLVRRAEALLQGEDL